MTLLDDVGGRPAVEALTDVLFGFAGRVVRDPLLGPFFRGVELGSHRVALTNTIVAFLDEPRGAADSTRLRWLADEHKGLGITGEHVNQLGRLVVLGLEDLGVDLGLIADVVAQLSPALDAINAADGALT